MRKKFSLYTDAAREIQTQRTGLGWVLIDEDGVILRAGCKFLLNFDSVAGTEAMAILWALNQVSEVEGEIHVYSDAQLVVQALNSDIGALAQVEPILFDILVVRIGGRSMLHALSTFLYLSMALRMLLRSTREVSLVLKFGAIHYPGGWDLFCLRALFEGLKLSRLSKKIK